MKYAIAGIFSILIGFYIGYSNSPTPSYIGTLPLVESMEIGCTNSYPLSEKCIKSILRPCHSDSAPDRVTYAWRKYRDMDFLLTVDAESRFDENAVGDQWRAFGYCQVRVDHNKWWYDRYKAMNTWQERLEECHRMYSEWKKKGNLSKRLYWYNARHLNKSQIKCYEN